MKTIFNKQIVDVCPKINFEKDTLGTGLITLKNGDNTGETCVEGWNHYQYEDNPLYFISIPKIIAKKKIDIIAKFDMWYGDTNKDTTEWALEFQLLTRMLIGCNMIMFNHHYLEVNDEMWNEIISIVW